MDRPSTRPTISDEAVMVATVAEPVARRISTASTHASSSTEMSLAAAQSASSVPMPVSTRTCLKPPPAATISRMPAIGGSDGLHDLRDLAPGPCPESRPSVNIATTSEINSANSGSPIRSSTRRSGCDLSSIRMSASALPIISADRQQHREQGDPERRAPGVSRPRVVESNMCGAGTSTQLAGQPAEERTGDDHRRDRDQDTERERRTQGGAQGVDRDAAARGAAAPARASPTGRPGPGCRP